MKFGFFVDPDVVRYSGLRLRRLKQAIKDPKILEALVEELGVTGAIGSNKMAAIERRIEELRATKGSLWYEVAAPEVLAASIFRAKNLQGPIVDHLFQPVARVEEMAAPLATWLDLAGLTAHPGRAPGLGRANLVGYRGRSMIGGGHVVGIEAINDLGELGRALDEPVRARENVTASYLAFTPALVAEFLWARTSLVPRWQAEALHQKAQSGAFGLLFVEGDGVSRVIVPQERKLDAGKLAAITSALYSSKPGG
ncbi:MAG TPA: hypothetical protein VH853_04335 [Polyangia bacterium]|nr:hypothetical protein [Polyangia bacterium]